MSVFGLTGGICILYGVMAMIIGQHDPIAFWIPGALGVVAAIVLTASSVAIGRKQAEMAWDESYRAEARQTAAIAFWVGIALNPIFTVLIIRGVVDMSVALVAMGTLTPGVCLLLIVWFDLRGRT